MGDNIIFNAPSIPAWKIDTRLNGKGHASLEKHEITRPDVWIFMAFHAQPVPRPMGKEISISSCLDHSSGGMIYNLSSNSRLGGFPTGCVGFHTPREECGH